jgi:hypothetical protein
MPATTFAWQPVCCLATKRDRDPRDVDSVICYLPGLGMKWLLIVLDFMETAMVPSIPSSGRAERTNARFWDFALKACFLALPRESARSHSENTRRRMGRVEFRLKRILRLDMTFISAGGSVEVNRVKSGVPGGIGGKIL